MRRTFGSYEPGYTSLGELPPIAGHSASDLQNASNFLAGTKPNMVWGQVTPGYTQSFLAAVREGFASLTPQSYMDFYRYFLNPAPLKTAAAGDPSSEAARAYDWILAANTVYRDLANEMSRGLADSAIHPGLPVVWKQFKPGSPPLTWDSIADALNDRIKLRLPSLGGASAVFSVGQTVASPASANAKIPVSWVKSDTTDPATNVRTLVYTDQSGRQLTITGYVRADGTSAVAIAKPVQVAKMAELVLSKAKSPGDGYHFAVVGWRLHDVDAANPTKILRSMGWNRWDGLVAGMSSETTRSSFLEDITDEVTRALAINDQRAAAYWDWPNLQAMVRQSGPGNPPPTNVGIDILAAPDSTSFTPKKAPAGAPITPPPQINAPVPSGTEPPPTTKPWTDIMAPPPPQPPPSIAPPPPGVPPVATVTGQLVHPGSLVLPSDDVTDEPPPSLTAAKPDTQSIALGGGVALLVGLGLLMLLNKRSRR